MTSRSELNKTRAIKHGMTDTVIYKRWKAMLHRCYNKNNSSYENYGGRGIKVCERWYKFENFYEDMSDPPFGMTLDRIDNDGDYCKENCEWIGIYVQNDNKRSSRLITYNNETHTLVTWARKLKINYSTLCHRLNRHKWTVERAFTTR